jgi:hypothetical protein
MLFSFLGRVDRKPIYDKSAGESNGRRFAAFGLALAF